MEPTIKTFKVLLVGDFHAEPSQLEDCYNLSDGIKDICDSKEVDLVCYLGDQFHTHSVLHLSVLDFWKNHFKKIKQTQICLVGNHDRSNNANSKTHAMKFFDNIVAVDDACVMNGILFLGYQFTKEVFIETCNKYPTATLICHQTVDGSKYENGFPAKDGIDLSLIPQASIISGHIHSAQTIGKCWYPGSPRWVTRSDSNIEKKLWLVTFDTNGNILEKEGFNTAQWCSAIVEYDIDEDHQSYPAIDAKNRVILNVSGTPDFIRKFIEKNQRIATIRTFPKKEKKIIVKESDGIASAFKKYIEAYTPDGVNKEEFVNWMQKLSP